MLIVFPLSCLIFKNLTRVCCSTMKRSEQASTRHRGQTNNMRNVIFHSWRLTIVAAVTAHATAHLAIKLSLDSYRTCDITAVKFIVSEILEIRFVACMSARACVCVGVSFPMQIVSLIFPILSQRIGHCQRKRNEKLQLNPSRWKQILLSVLLPIRFLRFTCS